MIKENTDPLPFCQQKTLDVKQEAQIGQRFETKWSIDLRRGAKKKKKKVGWKHATIVSCCGNRDKL